MAAPVNRTDWEIYNSLVHEFAVRSQDLKHESNQPTTPPISAPNRKEVETNDLILSDNVRSPHKKEDPATGQQFGVPDQTGRWSHQHHPSSGM